MSGMQSGRELQSGSPDTHQLGLPVADCSSVRVAKEVRLVDAEPPGAALVYIGNTVEARGLLLGRGCERYPASL